MSIKMVKVKAKREEMKETGEKEEQTIKVNNKNT